MVTKAVGRYCHYKLSNVLIHFYGFSFEDVLQAEAPLLLGEDDERVQTLKRVCDRLVSVLDNENFVCAAVWPRDSRSHVFDSSGSSAYPSFYFCSCRNSGATTAIRSPDIHKTKCENQFCIPAVQARKQ